MYSCLHFFTHIPEIGKKTEKSSGIYFRSLNLFFQIPEKMLDGIPGFLYNVVVLGDSLDPRLLGKILTDVFLRKRRSFLWNVPV